MHLKKALSIAFCPVLLDARSGQGLQVPHSLSPMALKVMRLSIAPFNGLLKLAYALRKPSSIAAATGLAALLVTLAFYPQTALLFSFISIKVSLVALRYLSYVVLQTGLIAVATRAWIRLNPLYEPLYEQNILRSQWDFDSF